MKGWLPDRWEAPERGFIGHRDILTQSLSRYHFLAPHIHGSLLDIGCGRGYGFEVSAPIVSTRVGIDISNMFLTKARAQYPDVFFARATANALPFSEKSFDSIVALEVIEHIQDDISFLDELNRVARSKAFIALSTPNRLISSGHCAKPLNRFHAREYTAFDFYQLLSRFFSSVELFGQQERVITGTLRDALIDRIPIRWKYLIPHYFQSIISVALRPPLRLEECHFTNENIDKAHTLIAFCRP